MGTFGAKAKQKWKLKIEKPAAYGRNYYWALGTIAARLLYLSVFPQIPPLSGYEFRSEDKRNCDVDASIKFIGELETSIIWKLENRPPRCGLIIQGWRGRKTAASRRKVRTSINCEGNKNGRAYYLKLYRG